MMEEQQSVSKNPEKTEQKHKRVGTHDIGSQRRTRSNRCAKLHLWCVTLCHRKKEYSKQFLGEPTKQFFKRIKSRSKECDEEEAGVSTAPYRESIKCRKTPKKSKRKEGEAEIVDSEDVSVEAREGRKERKERKKKEREERERKEKEKEEEEREKRERKEQERKERKERKERRKHVELMQYSADTHLVTRDKDLVVEDHIPGKPPPSTDFAKSCCYLCAQNTLAIAAATYKPEQSDKCIQVSAHKFRAVTTPALDKSCSPTTLVVRTVQSSVKVRTRETSTLFNGANGATACKETKPGTKKHKKFSVFPRLTRTKCPAGRHACETDKPVARRYDNAKKREPRNEKCCKEKNI